MEGEKADWIVLLTVLPGWPVASDEITTLENTHQWQYFYRIIPEIDNKI